MDGDKQVCLVLVGNVSTGMQGNEDIGLAGIDDLYIRAVLLHQLTKSQRHIQVDGFLLGNLTYGTSIIATMSGINDQRKMFIGSNNSCRHTHT